MPTDSHLPRTAEIAARETMQGDWDANGTTSVHLPAELAVTLLRSFGWVSDSPQAPYVSPHGLHAWSVGEALTIALVARAHLAS